MSAAHVRIPNPLHERIRKAAAEDRRSINSEMLHLWEEALDVRDRMAAARRLDATRKLDTTLRKKG